MRARAVVLLLAAAAAPQEKRFDVERFFASTPVVDGQVNVYSPNSAVGQPDFTNDGHGRSVKAMTGIDIGSMTCRNLTSIDRQVALAQTTWKGVTIIRTAADIDACLKEKKYGLILYSQTHPPLHGRVKTLKLWHRSGLRILNLQYGSGDVNQAAHERLGGGSDQTGGLTPLGRNVVVEMFRLGMIVDLSHCNEQTMLDTAALAREHKAPVIANHTCAREVKDDTGRAFANYERNITDKALRAIRDTGGVVGIMCYSPYLRRRGRGNTDDYMRHIEHAIKVAGIDHVGFSSDGFLDGAMAGGKTADGILDSATRWKEIVRRLHARGYTVEQLRKIAGGNFLRVYRRVLR